MNCQEQLNLEKSRKRERIEHATIKLRSQEFREAVDSLIGATSRHDTKETIARKNDFLKSIAKKCAYCSNAYTPYDVISRAYEIALRQIHQGKIIPNPEAWLKVTTMRLLMKERRKKGRARSSWYTPQSLDAPATSEGTRPLIEQVAAPRDRDNPYLVFDKAEAADKAANNHKRLAKALKGLTPFERKLLQLKQVENKSWKEIHRQLKFEGNIPALRKQGSRALSKVRKTYQALEDKV
ncbi:MAG: sigma-70 family RNA polymerase sigma factor [Cyanobacteria bacterium J06576_12]